MTSDRRAIGLGLAAVLCWSTAATAFKLALAEQSIYQLLWVANLTTLLVLILVLWQQGRLKSAVFHWAGNWRLSLVLGAINPSLYYLILLSAYDLLPAQIVQPINYTWAIVLSILSIPVLGHRFTRRDGVATLLAYTGVLVISGVGSARAADINGLGLALTLISTLVWPIYWLVCTRDSRQPTVAIFQNFVFALPITSAMFVLLSPEAVWNLKSLATGVYIGVFEMGIAFVFWSLALKKASRASLVSNLIFISPFLSLVFIHHVLGESIASSTLIGLAVIIAGLLIQSTQNTVSVKNTESA